MNRRPCIVQTDEEARARLGLVSYETESERRARRRREIGEDLALGLVFIGVITWAVWSAVVK